MPSWRRPATKVVVFQCPWGHPADQTRPPSAPATGASHVGLGPGLVDEDEPSRIKPYFETASETCDWLNRVVTVGVGRRLPDHAAYDVFEIL